jgi:hypothetical protein
MIIPALLFVAASSVCFCGNLLGTAMTSEAPHPLPRGAYTYEVSSGSLGDHLLCYARARWLSYRHQIPLIVKPFPFSDHLRVAEGGLTPEVIARGCWDRRHSLSHDPLTHFPSPGEVWEVPYFPESFVETAAHFPWVPFFQVDWTDNVFLQELRMGIRPISCGPAPYLPEDRLCIAVHWRTGEGQRLSSYRKPLCSVQYYQRELQRLLKRIGPRPIYLHLFTDDPYPLELLEKLQAAAQGFDADIHWAARRPEVQASARVLEDLFLMARFDVLLRGSSSYAFIAARIGDVALEIFPADVDWSPTMQPTSFWKLKPGISLDSLFAGWRLRWAGFGTP